jgi:hypothetical protein
METRISQIQKGTVQHLAESISASTASGKPQFLLASTTKITACCYLQMYSKMVSRKHSDSPYPSRIPDSVLVSITSQRRYDVK